MGFIHKNMSIERQAEEVRRVKKHESGIVSDPQTVLPTTTLHEVKALTERNGFAGYPVVTEENELVGIITGRDVRFVTDLNQPVSVYMTPKERLLPFAKVKPATWCWQKCTKNALKKRWLLTATSTCAA